MQLHKDKVLFKQMVEAVSLEIDIEPALIEKDYFVTLFLKKLNERVPNLLFKGGTSLSKCHKIIDRFSEDIDLTLTPDHQTQGQRRKLKYTLIDVCKDLELNLLNESDTRSRRDYNCYHIEYPIEYLSGAVKPMLLVETVFIQKAYPYEIKPVDSIIGDWLRAKGNLEAIEKYELTPFDIRVQTLERTLVDKVFAICDYMMDDNAAERQSRHIYDIFRLLTKVSLDDNLKVLVKDVREDRKTGVKSFSAKDGVKVSKILREVVDSRFYERDYNESTLLLLLKPVTYDEAISSIEKIIKSGVFEQ